MGDEVKVTVIAAGFDRWDGAPGQGGRPQLKSVEPPPTTSLKDLFAEDERVVDDPLDGDDDFDVPSFLK